VVSPPLFDRTAVVAVLATAVAALASGSASAGVTSALKCLPVTIPVTITKTIPMTYVDITVSGVSCTYAEKVFLIDTSKAGSDPPTGWDIRITAAADGAIQDTCTRGKQTITFRFPRKT
jgi:hypothetical protein